MTLLDLAVTAQTLSLPFFLLLGALGIVLAGFCAYFLFGRRPTSQSAAPLPVTQMGYGRERWERELALWQGILRRLEIQAKFQPSITERLQREIAEAKTKIAEAEAH